MFGVIKIATLAAFVRIVEGHVRAIPTGASGFGCRDCNGKATPGPFRVNGPLGANGKQFGANGGAKVAEGQSVELAIGYNGGHRSNRLNFFTVRYACGNAANAQATFRNSGNGQFTKATANCAPPCQQLTAAQIEEVDGAAATAQNYPVDATQSKQSGYKVKFKIPAIAGTGDQRKCTFALVEGRDWGAAWDFDIQAANAPPPPATTTPPPRSLSGTYKFSAQNCQNDAPNCACLGGEVTVQHAAGAAEADALINIPGYPNQMIKLKQEVPGALSVNYVLAKCGKGDQELDITLAPEGQSATNSVLNVGIIANVPTICGSIVKNSAQTSPMTNPPAIQQCPNCEDIKDWKDSGGDGCDAYKSCANGAWRSKGLAHYQKYADAQGQTARDACCACGGGNTKRAPTVPTAAPTVSTTTTVPAGVSSSWDGTTRRNDVWGTGAIVQDDGDGVTGMGVTLGAVLAVFAGTLI